MSSGLNESENYIWKINSDEDCLGEGSFGKVFLGVHKRTGDKVAIKTFKHVTPQVSKETQMLQTLKHQYIIQLLALELEETTKSMVMVMELCNGGSLMSFLNEPENACGLSDDEYLLVFEHLSRGLDYLKRHNVIHRDVKPDNIMRQILADGRTVYKLADFGTARELPEGAKFESLHGTEPYLNPQVFKGYFFEDGSSPRRFGAETDLWSVGVTLYQIATGTLPFVVQDRHVMLAIYHEMQRNQGVIAATQKRNTEQVIFQKKLPSGCRMSVGLKELITPIIGGLFVQQPAERRWSFAHYFENVMQVLNRRSLDVFYVNRMQALKVYAKSEDSFEDLKSQLSKQTGIDESNQVFLYKRTLIVNSFEEFAGTELDSVLFVFDRGTGEVEPVSSVHLVYDNLAGFRTKFLEGGGDEFRLAQIACRDLCICKNLMDYQSTVYKQCRRFIADFNAYCEEERKEHRKTYDVLLERFSSTKSRIDILEKLQNLSDSVDTSFVDEFRTVTDRFVEQIDRLFADLTNAKSEQVRGQEDAHDSYLKMVVNELSDLKANVKRLYRSASNPKLFEYEKIKIVKCVRTILEILTDHVEPNFERFVDDVKNWYKKAFFTQVRSLSVLKKVIDKYRGDLKRFEEQIDNESDESLKKIGSMRGIGLSREKFEEMIEKYKRNQVDLKALLDENSALVERINGIVLDAENLDVFDEE